MPGTTIYINPLLGDLKIKTALGGMFTPAGQKVIHVEWPNGGSGGGSPIPSSAAAFTGMTNLYNAIIANLADATLANPMNIVGHSGGAQIIMRLLREKGAALQAALSAAGKSLAVLRFYPMGCPEQKFTGASYLYPTESPAIYPGTGTKCGTNGGAHDGACLSPLEWHGGHGLGSGLPLDCPFYVDVVSNEFDGWSMAPTNMSHPALTKQYDVLLFVLPRKVWDHNPVCYMKSSTGPHGRYDTKDSKSLSHADAFVYEDPDPLQPNVNYWYIRTYPFPGYDKLKWLRGVTRDLDKKNRSGVGGINSAFAATDSTHGMQIVVPPPDYSTVRSWFPVS